MLKAWVRIQARIYILATMGALTGCGVANSTQTNHALPSTSAPYLKATGPNVMPVHIGPSAFCGNGSYENEPCTSVTVCSPGTNQCKTITDVLVDTGSVGLRIFATSLGINLPHKMDAAGNTLAQCLQFGTGSTWGPVATAAIGLGQEPLVTTPIQLIDKSFVKTPTDCADADRDPVQAGYNGILGVGLFAEDCGALCEGNSGPQVYYSCTSSTCIATSLSRSEQIQNPVALLPNDGNGVLLALPPVDLGGVASADGVLVLGIGTQANNAPSGVAAHTTDSQGNFTTRAGGKLYPGSFIDSGTNGLFFPNYLGLPVCGASGNAASFYCPLSLQSLVANNLSNTGGVQVEVPFYVGNAASLTSNTASALSDLGGVNSQSFDWGLPFFYGRAVFVGIEGKSSILEKGMYWAY